MPVCSVACSLRSSFLTEVSRWSPLTGQTSSLTTAHLKVLNSSALRMTCYVFAALSMLFCAALPTCQ